jgi:hypothetical protein
LKIISIALNTFRESVRDRVLYNLVLFVLLLIVASVVMGRITVGQEAKITIDNLRFGDDANRLAGSLPFASEPGKFQLHQ